ncbi:MAG: prolyl oligopeptidase family serine peptidase [Planctomycetota bacterium]
MNNLLRLLAVLLAAGVLHSQSTFAQVPGYPDGVRAVMYVSDADDTTQPTLIWTPPTDAAVPLLVALHTWSHDYRQAGGEAQYANWCQEKGWAFVHPHFRGVNRTPSALGSDLVVADILSVIRHAKTVANIDHNRIYCVGVSGGGHASLLMAARAPKVWAGVSSWCGISDIALWHRQCLDGPFERYSRHIETVLGGTPLSTPQRRADAKNRSPVNWIAGADSLPPLDINHGINDGRDGSVPFTQSILAWNAAVPGEKEISTEMAALFYDLRSVPSELEMSNEIQPGAGKAPLRPVFRRTAGDVRLTIFNGGHEIDHGAALNWLSAQSRGAPTDWNVDDTSGFRVPLEDTRSGK